MLNSSSAAQFFLNMATPVPPLAQTYYIRFWMLHHDGGSSKRTIVYTNVAWAAGLDKGRLSKEEKLERTTLKPVSLRPSVQGRCRMCGPNT